MTDLVATVDESPGTFDHHSHVLVVALTGLANNSRHQVRCFSYALPSVRVLVIFVSRLRGTGQSGERTASATESSGRVSMTILVNCVWRGKFRKGTVGGVGVN